MNLETSFGLGSSLYRPAQRAIIAKPVIHRRKKTIETIADLTPRKLEMVKLLCLGLCNKEIAQQMGISPGTVKEGLFRLYADLKVYNRTEVVLWVYRQRFGEFTWENYGHSKDQIRQG